MRKFNKLFLTILPISSISAFSVISCTTNTKNNNQIPTIPNNTKPDNQKQPSDKKPGSTEEHTNKKPNENTNNQKQPNSSEKSEAEPSPGKPENKPDNSHNPKQPEQPKKPEHNDSNSNNNTDNNNSNADQPQGDEPQDKPWNKVDFSDVNKLDKEVKFQFFTTYSRMDAKSAWVQIQGRQPAIFKEIIFKGKNEILNRYEIEFDSQKVPNIVDEKGTIDNVGIKFSKNGKSKTREFVFTGFKKLENKVDKGKNKDEYIKPKTNIDKSLSGIFPSLVAYMLLYSEETQSNNKYDRNIKQSGNVINFDELKNKNLELFGEDFVGFSVGTKELLFDYKNEYNKIYKDKIVAARYDDINGILELEVQVSNTDEYENRNDPTKSYKFTFKGFRSIDFDNPNKNVLSISLQQRFLKKLVDDKILKTIIDQLVQHNHFNHKAPVSNINNSNLKGELFEKLTIDIIDDENHLYKSSQTLKIDLFKKENNNKSILGLKNQMSIYPFHSRITKDSIKNIYITINNKNSTKELELEAEIEIPIYSSTLTDLTDHTYAAEKPLKITVKQSVKLNQ
ncbi:LppA family lipoprotein [Mycoplasma mycoides subsp. capri]|uniref:LppA family lipoprotein n=1 Tax=Mycoplasma mycoides TaxID=2102 RepID=UPI00223F62B4|nr:LppA family lipoprotein [Mycoplasma mycoides]QVK02133.1 LppA family lipoprotein [Mycoplasma mycoides subsp. capri]